MRNNIFRVLLIIAILSSLFIGWIMYQNMMKKERVSDFVFSKVILDIEKLNGIAVYNQENTYNFFLEDGLWRLKEADGYYVSHKIFNGLFTDIYNSKYYSYLSKENDEPFEESTKIDFYKNTDQIVDSIVVGGKSQNGYNFARKDGEALLISGEFNLPKLKISWIEQPQFNINSDNISRFDVISDYGEIKSPNFSKLSTMMKDYFSYMFFEDTLTDDNFTYEATNGSRVISIETLNGLIVDMNVMNTESGYWSSLSIKTNNLPKKETRQYVDDNAFLYEGWYFKIPDDFGVQFFKEL